MKKYVHKHIAFESDYWEKIENYMETNKIDNFTNLIRQALVLIIHQN